MNRRKIFALIAALFVGRKLKAATTCIVKTDAKGRVIGFGLPEKRIDVRLDGKLIWTAYDAQPDRHGNYVVRLDTQERGPERPRVAVFAADV